MKGLTKKQRTIIQFIHDFVGQHQFSPSYREIMTHFSFASLGTVYKHIATLKRKGVLTSEKNCSRSIQLLENITSHSRLSTEITLPFVGTLSTETNLELFVQPQTLSVPSHLVSDQENTYILRVEGNGLEEELVIHGDLLLIEARQDIQEGELIIGLINQHDVLLKRFYSEGQYIRLEGHSHQPLILRTEYLQIQGVVISLIRMY